MERYTHWEQDSTLAMKQAERLMKEMRRSVFILEFVFNHANLLSDIGKSVL